MNNNYQEQEKKNRKIGMAISLGAHALLILIFFFLIAWKRPHPPLPEYGIELNLGFSETGVGDIQPRSEQPVREQPQPQPEENIEEEVEEAEEQPVNEPEPQPSEEEEIAQPPVQETGPDVIDEPKPEKQTVEKNTTQPAPKEEKKEEVNKEALYPGSAAKDEKNSETSQGDKGKTGDQGIKEGDIDSRAIYGKQGGGDGGPLINLSNWNWDNTTLTKDPSSENGKIVFEIKVDDRGEIIAIRVIETTVSPRVVKFYQNQVEDFTFTFNPSKPGATPATESTGTITLFIRPQ